MQIPSIANSGFSSPKAPGLQVTNASTLDEVSSGARAASGDQLQALRKSDAQENGGELREKFQDFVGQTFFAELIKSLRTAQKGAAYFNGGRAEEIFQGQFDQQMAEHLSDASAKSISDPMFELFQLGRAR